MNLMNNILIYKNMGNKTNGRINESKIVGSEYEDIDPCF